MDDLAGLQLSDYLIEAPLGQGGMATVYRARHVGLGRECALKVLGPELARDQHFIERFGREARSAAQLDHPNIVPIYDMGNANGRYFIAMKLLPGDTLQRIGGQGPLPPKRLLVYLDQIASALDYAHAHGVIHRDIKPSNIIVTQFGQVTLTDFGIARRVDDPGVTMAGMLLGTPAYMAPEQVRGGETSPQTDIYQLGAMSYELLAGAPPFDGPTAQAVMAYHLQETPPPLHERRPELGPGIDAVIQRAMAKQPEQRYASAGEFVAAARNALEGPDVAAHMGSAVPLVAAAAPLAGVAAMQPQEPMLPAPPLPPAGPPPESSVVPPAEPAAPIGGGGTRRPLLLGCGAVALLFLCVVAFGAAWWITRDDDDEPAGEVVAAQNTPTGGVSATSEVSVTRQPTEAGDPTPTSPGAPAASSPIVSDATATLPNVPVPTALSDAEPGATLEIDGRLAYSGAITTPGQTLDFTFNSAGNQQFFMDVLEGETTNLVWTLLDPNGQTLPPNGTLSTSIGDAGPYELLAPGVYTIHVAAWDNAAVDSFRFQLWDVPPPDEQDIQQGSEASGTLETPGREDLYHFAGQAGQQVLVDVTAGENTSIQYQIVHETGMIVYNSGVMSTSIGDSGPLPLDLDGRYTLRVYPYLGATGAYAFKLWSVPPPQEFDIAIGEEVRRGAPGSGAGEIESPGVQDIYRFQVESGTAIMMDVIEGENIDVWWILAHENGTVIINDYPMSTAIGDTEPIELTQGGVYILTVYGYQDGTGAYAFRLTTP